MVDLDYFANLAEPLNDGTWVNSKLARIVEIINDYDSMLEVRWIPRDKRHFEDDVFQIVDKRINRVAFSVKDENSFNESVLNQIFEADMEKNSGGPISVVQKIEIANKTKKLLSAKKWEEELEDKEEMLKTIVGSPLNAYKHNGYRFDLPNSEQPKKVIFDVSFGNKK